MKMKQKRTTTAVILGAVLVILILALGTGWMGQSAKKDTEGAVRSVSLLYLAELAGRREQVVENNLQNKIEVIRIAIGMLTDEDLSDKAHLEAYQTRMKQLFKLDKFAFVNTNGLIYTSTGTQDNIAEYGFDYQHLTEPEISVFNLQNEQKQVIIAVPVDLSFQGEKLSVCFMAIDMSEMLSGLLMNDQSTGTTFSNIYTSTGVALSNQVLAGQAAESNLLEALKHAEFEKDYSYDEVAADFAEGRQRSVSFVYNGTHETLSYVPIQGTNWMMTYLIRESVISNEISTISNGIITRSVIQSLLTVLVVMGMFLFIFRQNRKNAQLQLEKETADAENRVKREEMEHRLALQEELLARRKQGEEQNRMITALASDYWSVYYLVLDTGEGVCYQEHSDLENGFRPGDKFHYMEAFSGYADLYVKEEFRDEFMKFIQPDHIRDGLKEQRVIAYRYIAHRNGKDSYEEVRFAGVRHPEDREDHLVHAVGACFVNVDRETRKAMEQNIALQEALTAAETANRAKTAFLSNMSHEIRTPMNAIIGLDSIALNDPEISDQTRENLEKIGISAKHLLNIINDILDMSRIESGRMIVRNEEFSFQQALEQVNTIISGQCRDKGLEYTCYIQGQIDEYYIGDDMKLRQVLINILGNAVKFTPAGGKVSFLIEDVARFDSKDTLRFTISDTGIGMSREYLPKLFDPFSQEDSSTTSRYGSTGLGMPITRSIVELMNGHIDVESEKGKGTTFTVTVTLTESSYGREDQNGEELQAKEMNVLVIDDDPIACEHAQVVLGQIGINCESAASGPEGLEMIRVRHARRDDYNLVLVDWKMPEMDGVETTRQIRDILGNNTPIIILTSYNWDEIAEEARKAGVDTFVSKPLFAGTVMDEFRKAFKQKKTAPEKHRAELKGRRILVAEDVEVNAEIMVMVLGMREIQADVAKNGRIALETFSGSPEGTYDAILMDMRMPEMDGLEATRAIRALNRKDSKTIPIIALTANAFDEDVQRSLQAGLNAHLSKPVDPETLFETLESLIPD